MLKTNRTIVAEALREMVREMYGHQEDEDRYEDEEEKSSLRDSTSTTTSSSSSGMSSSVRLAQLERDVNRLIDDRQKLAAAKKKEEKEESNGAEGLVDKAFLRRRISSRASSIESNPGSPFQVISYVIIALKMTQLLVKFAVIVL